jgi:hypothetical protein
MEEVERRLRTIRKAVGVQVGYGACLSSSNELQAYTSSQPLAHDGSYLVREERQRMRSQGGGSGGCWVVGEARASPEAGEEVERHAKGDYEVGCAWRMDFRRGSRRAWRKCPGAAHLSRQVDVESLT